MVSTVGLPPGVAPSCANCGRAFPGASAASSGPAPRGSGALGWLLVVPLLLALFGLPAFFLTSRRAAIQERLALEVASRRPTLDAQTSRQLDLLIVQLADEDGNKAMQAWHGIASFDAQDHEGTFQRLKAALLATDSYNLSWIVTGGFCEYYGDPGEDALVEALVRHQGNPRVVEGIAGNLEAYPDEIGRGGDGAARQQYLTKSLRILDFAAQKIDDPVASPRILRAVQSLRAKQLSAEQR